MKYICMVLMQKKGNFPIMSLNITDIYSINFKICIDILHAQEYYIDISYNIKGERNVREQKS